MRVFVFCVLLLLIYQPIKSYSQEYLYILNDNCIKELYTEAVRHFQNKEIQVIKDSRGIILRTKIENPELETFSLSQTTYLKASSIEYFLAKIQKPAIIEVHVEEFKNISNTTLKKWEISTIIANKIESAILKSGRIKPTKINSVGYGEFLPAKNTPNNGGKYTNRLDIIILCNISGE